MLLAMVFDAETPFGTIRTQASQLATSLAEGEGPEEAAAPDVDELEAMAPPVEELEDEDEGLEMPPISEILKDIPVPDPIRQLASPSAQAAPPASPTVATQVPAAASQAPVEPPPMASVEAVVQRSEDPATPVQPIDAAATRPSIFAHETTTPTRMSAMPAEDASTVPSSTRTDVRPPAPPVSSVDQTVASQPQPRPETPVRVPQPGELDETRPSARVELPPQELSLASIVLEPISAGVYHLSYACLLLPRFATHFLTGDMADRLSEWIPIICVAFGWRLEHLAVRPEYLQWVVNVPPATSPGYVMRVIRQQLSDKVFSAFPRLKRDNPSGDFWAPGYLIMGGSQPHPPQLVKDYIRQIRQRQGIEKPQNSERFRH